jgi:hypothetical protein
MSQHRFIFRGHVVDGRDELVGYNQNVCRCLGIDVAKRRMILLKIVSAAINPPSAR